MNGQPDVSSLPLRVVFALSQDLASQDTSAHNLLILTANTWDDYGFKTTFDLSGIHEGSQYYLGRYRVLIQGKTDSVEVFQGLARRSGGQVEFPIKNIRYLSLADGIEVYRRLLKLYYRTPLLKALQALNDVTILEMTSPDSAHLSLREEKGFKISLLRSTSDERAYREAAALIGIAAQSRRSNSFFLRYQLQGFVGLHEIRFRFSQKPLRMPINVLIGKNGVGKTQALKMIVEYMVGIDRGAPDVVERLDFVPLHPRPRFSQVVAVSYNPFDTFPLEAESDEHGENSNVAEERIEFESSRRKHLDYVFCGLRSNEQVGSLRTAHQQAVRALTSILLDYREDLNELDISRLSVSLSALRQCIDFDTIGVSLSVNGEVRNIDLIKGSQPTHVRPGTLKALDGTLYFSKRKLPLYLSAGQNHYVLLTLMLCAYMKNRTLVLLDEPEMGMHPNLIVDFMRAFKHVLQAFDSYAVIATHSMLVAREVPRKCVNVLSADSGIPYTRTPVIETFGADVSVICNEVFGDLDVDPAYEGELIRLASRAKSYKTFLEKYGEELGQEALMFVLNEVFPKEAKRKESSGP